MDALCTNCGTRILRRCGYSVTIHSVLVDHSFCTLACLAEWAGSKNMQMQHDFATDVQVDIEREDPDEV